MPQAAQRRNYVLWGGREGYERNAAPTPILDVNSTRWAVPQSGGRVQAQIGFKGTILIEPKPRSRPKHQYDYDGRDGL